MKYSINWLLDSLDKGEPADYLFFWGHTQKQEGITDNSCFSQWFPSPFKVDGLNYYTAEHWMMAGKAKLFNDAEMLEQIVKAEKPAVAKALGRKVRNFDEKQWSEAAYKLVLEGNFHKFSQHASLKQHLLHTGNKIIVEASPFDKIWGIGMAKTSKTIMDPASWKGKNLLGFALMETRDQLKEQNNGQST